MRTFAQKPPARQQISTPKSTIPDRGALGQRRQRLLQVPEGLELLTGVVSPRLGHDFSRVPAHSPAAGGLQPERLPQSQLQRTCACGGECAECKKKKQELQRFPLSLRGRESASEGEAPAIVHEVLRSPGQPLDAATRSFMESRFGHAFRDVRLHCDARAAESAHAVNAEAYTVGRDVVFGAGRYAPQTEEGRRLLAHELTHVVQQRNVAPAGGLTIGSPRSSAEQEAESASAKVLNRSDTVTHVPGFQRAQHAAIMRSRTSFSSTMEICHRLLESRVFQVSEGGIRVTTNAAYEQRGSPECSDANYHITLEQKGIIYDSEYGTCEFPQGRPFSRQWANLPKGEYYLTIWTNNTNPYCCLTGHIEVEEQSGLSGESCTVPPPGPLEILHSALDLAGLIPVLGAVPDGINAGIYLIEGDWANAGLSGAAMVPIFGEGVTVTKLGVKVTKEAIERTGKETIQQGLKAAKKEAKAGKEVVEAAAEKEAKKAAEKKTAQEAAGKKPADGAPEKTSEHKPEEKKPAKPKSSRCSDAVVTLLHEAVKRVCKGYSCSMQGDDCASATAKVAAGYACIAAREKMQKDCWKKGDPGYEGHMKQIADVYAANRHCLQVLAAKCEP